MPNALPARLGGRHDNATRRRAIRWRLVIDVFGECQRLAGSRSRMHEAAPRHDATPTGARTAANGADGTAATALGGRRPNGSVGEDSQRRASGGWGRRRRPAAPRARRLGGRCAVGSPPTHGSGDVVASSGISEPPIFLLRLVGNGRRRRARQLGSSLLAASSSAVALTYCPSARHAAPRPP